MNKKCAGFLFTRLKGAGRGRRGWRRRSGARSTTSPARPRRWRRPGHRRPAGGVSGAASSLRRSVTPIHTPWPSAIASRSSARVTTGSVVGMRGPGRDASSARRSSAVASAARSPATRAGVLVSSTGEVVGGAVLRLRRVRRRSGCPVEHDAAVLAFVHRREAVLAQQLDEHPAGRLRTRAPSARAPQPERGEVTGGEHRVEHGLVVRADVCRCVPYAGRAVLPRDVRHEVLEGLGKRGAARPSDGVETSAAVQPASRARRIESWREAVDGGAAP